MNKQDQAQIQKDLLSELGLSDLPQDKKDELLIKMTEVILKRMFAETMEKLKPADQDAYGEMLDREARSEEIEKFLREKIENYDQLLEKVVSDFREEMKKDANL